MNMIVNLFGKQIAIVELKLNKTKTEVNFYNQNPYEYDYSVSRQAIAEIPNDYGLIRYLMKIFREYELSDENGYLKFENRSGEEVYLHRVIMEYYAQFDTKLYTVLTNPDYEINHKNKNKWDNRLENLEFVTHQNNSKHSKGLAYEVVMTSEEIIQIKDYLKQNKQYKADKKYLEKVNAYNIDYLTNGNLYWDCNKKFFDNLYIKISSRYIRFSNKFNTTTKTTPTYTFINNLSDFDGILFTNTKNTFFTQYNTLCLSTNYNIYRCKNIIQNNLQLIFKYYKQNKYFRNILNKYKLLNHQDIIKDLNNEINTTTYLNNNILLDLFYYITPQRLPITFYKNHLFIIISIKDLILSFGKYNSFKTLYTLQLLERKAVSYNKETHTASCFLVPKYTDDLFTTTVLPKAKLLNQLNLSKITHTILTKNQTLEEAQRVYKNTSLIHKTKNDLLTIQDIINVLSSDTTKEEINSYGFISASYVRYQLQILNEERKNKLQPFIEVKDTDDKFVTSMIRNITEIKNLITELKAEYTIVNLRTKQKIEKYQLNNGVEDTATGITHNQRLMVLKKLIVKNKKRQNSTKRNKTPTK